MNERTQDVLNFCNQKGFELFYVNNDDKKFTVISDEHMVHYNFAVLDDTPDFVQKDLEKDTIAITWSVEDVKSVCPHLNDGQARKVLYTVAEKHDATIGVNWDTLKITADCLFPEPKVNYACLRCGEKYSDAEFATNCCISEETETMVLATRAMLI